MTMVDDLKIAYAGMSHLGLNTLAAAAARGLHVAGFDPDAAHIEALKAGELTIDEPLLQETLQENAFRIDFDHRTAIFEGCDVAVIALDVPTDDAGLSDLAPLMRLIQRVDAALPADRPLVILSQVPPGFCRNLALVSGRPLYYQVETLVFGQAVDRALNPERFIIGLDDPSTPLLPKFQAYLEAFDCPILPMRYESAELAKISINCCLVASISTANMLAELSEAAGADWSEIAPALKLDKRIGPHAYLQPGLGIAGGNLERDLRTVSTLAARYGTDAKLTKAWTGNSAYRRDWVLRLLHRKVFPVYPTPRLAIWGLAYKKDTNSVKNSPSLALLDTLGTADLHVFDPVLGPEVVSNRALQAYKDPIKAATGADVLIIMTPWDVFADQSLAPLKSAMRGAIIIDPYAVLAPKNPSEAGFSYYRLGCSSDTS